jgi:hypothetical protein
MRRSFAVLATMLLSSAISGANEKPPVVQEVIHATPQKIKTTALATLQPDGYVIDSNTATQLEISRPISSEEIARYNSENWTNLPVSDCRHKLTLILTPDSQATSVTINSATVCRADGYDGFFKMWGVWSRDSEREVQWMQSTLTNLRVRVEGSNQWH